MPAPTPLRTWLRCMLLPLCLCLCLCLAGAGSLAGAATAGNSPVVVQAADVALWPAATLLSDPSGRLTLQQALAQPQRFEVPEGVPGNLGRRQDTVWLHIPLQVPGDAPLQRVLEIDYPALNRVDVFLLRQGRLQAQYRLGNELPLAQRPMPTRSHAVALTLAPGATELVLRVQTTSSMLLPLVLRTPEAFALQESRSLWLQGGLIGLSLCMLVYSLAHWVTLRDRVFLAYALMIVGNAVFFMSFFGVGAQLLWPESPQVSQQLSPLALLVTAIGGTAFTLDRHAMRDISPWAARLLLTVRTLALAGLAASVLHLVPYGILQTLAMAGGVLGVMVLLPVSLVQAWRGDRPAAVMAVGWALYLLGALAMSSLIRGHIEPTFWAQYLYPMATMLEMGIWMAVLSMRVQDIHRNADRTRIETEALRALSQTDALTGLPNRRGLQAQMANALAQAGPQQLLAVYLLDLDGFKPVNDRYGHDVGDALLVAVGQRLQAQLRASDVVARLGGDEFVVLAAGLADEHTAHTLGQKLLQAFEAPVTAAGQHCEVGVTIGYALAPLDGTTAEDLIKRADAAMYAGKQAGRRRVRRGGRSVAGATA